MSNFDIFADRLRSDDHKYSTLNKNSIALTVADMDFVAPQIFLNSLKERIEKGYFGYVKENAEWKESIISWNKRKKGIDLANTDILFSTGVIPAFASILREFTTKGDNILLNLPAYNAFLSVIKNNNRNIVSSPFVYDKSKHIFSFDLNNLEEHLKKDNIKIFLLCSPHNPTGYIYSKDELKNISYLCDKYNVLVLSDEIHSEILDNDKVFNPYFSNSLNDNFVVLTSATKSFSIAGLRTAYLYSKDKELTKRIKTCLNNDEVNEGGTFSYLALTILYNECEDWLSECNTYIENNKNFVKDFCKKENLKIYPINMGATYLMWIDISNYINKDITNSEIFTKKLSQSENLYLSPGVMFSESDGKTFVRMNIATPCYILQDALNRLKRFITTIH